MPFTMTIQDGGLGLVPASVAGASVKLGICSDGLPATFYSAGDAQSASSQLGVGPLVEALADTLNVAGGPQYAMPVTPSTPGTVSATTYAGPGTGTVVASRAPHKQIRLKIELGGTNGTMTFRYSVGTNAYSAVIASTGGTFAFPVPGTLATATFAAAQTWVATDVYTISTLGVVTLTGSGPAASNVTHVSSPLDGYAVRVVIVTSGGLGVGVFTYSVDGSNNTSAQILIPSGGVYAIPNTGVVLTFAGTFTADALPYQITATTAAFSTSDVNTAMTALLGDATEWGFVHVVGQAVNAAGAASMASTLDTHMTAAEAAFRYAFAVVECPTLGSIHPSGTSAEADSAVATAFAAFISNRVMVCAGDIGHKSALSARVIRRNCGVVVTTKLSKIVVGLDPAWIEEPPAPIKNVKSLYRDEGKTPYLDAQRFTTMTTVVGLTGYFVTHGNMMATGGSDYSLVQHRRIMDVACRVTRAGLLPVLNEKLTVDKKTGKIHPREAERIEARMRKKLEATVVDTGDASDAEVVVDRNENMLSTKKLKVAVRVTPNAYAGTVEVTIGFQNPALA